MEKECAPSVVIPSLSLSFPLFSEGWRRERGGRRRRLRNQRRGPFAFSRTGKRRRHLFPSLFSLLPRRDRERERKRKGKGRREGRETPRFFGGRLRFVRILIPKEKEEEENS